MLRIVDCKNRYNIDPYYLLFLLSHKLVSMQAFNKILIETTLPNIADRWRELMLPITNDINTRIAISNKVKDVINSKRKAVENIINLQQEYGNLTT